MQRCMILSFTSEHSSKGIAVMNMMLKLEKIIVATNDLLMVEVMKDNNEMAEPDLLLYA